MLLRLACFCDFVGYGDRCIYRMSYPITIRRGTRPTNLICRLPPLPPSSLDSMLRSLVAFSHATTAPQRFQVNTKETLDGGGDGDHAATADSCDSHTAGNWRNNIVQSQYIAALMARGLMTKWSRPAASGVHSNLCTSHPTGRNLTQAQRCSQSVAAGLSQMD